MKGITPIVAIIVLLLITIAIAGAGYAFITGYYESTVSKVIQFKDSYGNTVVVSNIGTKPIKFSELKATTDDGDATILGDLNQEIQPGKSASIQFVPQIAKRGLSVRFRAPGNAITFITDIVCFDGDGDTYWSNSGCDLRDLDCDDTLATGTEVYPEAPEVCDGKDNQCPGDVGFGQIDEESDTDGFTACGIPADCDPNDNSVYPGAPKLCDNKDNDCDETIDDFSESCYTGLAGTENVGLCHGGTRTCTSSTWGSCSGEVTPIVEVCDGLDNDCEGNPDNGNPGSGGLCGTTDIGACEFGTYQCSGGSLVCTGNVEPVLEICDGLDNDCDNVPDGAEGISPRACYTGPPATRNVGECIDGTESCTNTGWSGICTNEITPQAEVCNGNDDDCDGLFDNNAGSTWYRDDDGDGYGTNTDTLLRCSQPAGYASQAGDCRDDLASVNPVATETCNGLDDNCDGLLDNLASGSCVGLPGTIIAAGSTAVSEGDGSDVESWNHKVFYDSNNKRWHVLYIDNNDDLHSRSSYVTSVTTPWSNGAVITPSDAIAYEGFDAVIDHDGTDTFLHVVYASEFTNDDIIKYKRCQLTGTSPYIACGAQYILFDASAQGWSGTQYLRHPRITIDSNRCLVVAFDYVQASNWKIGLTREKAPCGDGIWNSGTDAEFAIQSIQNGGGYPLAGDQNQNEPGVGIESFGDRDVQIFWRDTYTGDSWHLETVYFNGITNIKGIQRRLSSDIEGDAGYTSHWSVITGLDTITFGMQDNLRNLLAYKTTGKDGPASLPIDTNIDMLYLIRGSGQVACVVDIMAPGGDDIWCFATDNINTNSIWYTKSTNGGISWSSVTNWILNGGTIHTRFLSAHFNKEHCIIMLTWMGGGVNSGVYDIRTKALGTGSC